jgi:carboxyl-terminal processing protease
MKKIAIFLAATLCFAPFSLSALAQQQRTGRSAHPTPKEIRDMSTQGVKLADFYRIMAGYYLDTMNYEAVVEKGIVSMLAELDPHSVYLTAKELKTSNEELGGGFSGIGIEFNTLADTIIVVNTIVGGPAEKVGLLPGDRIVSVDNKSSVGVSRAEVPKLLRGPKGTKVDLEVFRRGAGKTLKFTIVRDDIPINTIDAVYRPAPHTGYIKVNRFGSTTGREFSEAFNLLNESSQSDSLAPSQPPIDGLILDLRGNGGGFLPEAIRMSEFFLDLGQRIVSTEGNMFPSQSFDSQKNGRFNHGRLIVLVDEFSASASEIVAGAVQDWDRGIIIGNTTFGKGLVQREFDLNDGSAVRLTIAKYLTPTGRAIQRPYERGNAEGYYRDLVTRSNAEHHGQKSDSIKSPEFRTLRSGRTVYGGGGIRPDLILTSDTTGYSAYWAALVRTGRMREFIQSHLDSNRALLTARYKTVDSYIAGFDATPLIAQLADYAAKNGIARDETGLATSRTWLASQIKALIAQQLWDTAAYYRVSHSTYDDTFIRALDMMTRWRTASLPDSPVTDQLLQQLSQ